MNDRRAGAFAYAAGIVGIITFIAVGLMYGTEIPSGSARVHRRLSVSALSRFIGGAIGLAGWVGTPFWFLGARRELRAQEVVAPSVA